MAGWKLRKDKTQTETPGAENTTEGAPPTTEHIAVPPVAEAMDLLPLPSSRWETPETEWETPVEDQLVAPQEITVPHAEAEAAVEEEELSETDDDLLFEEEDTPLTFLEESPALTEESVPTPPAIAAPLLHEALTAPLPEIIAAPPTEFVGDPEPEMVADPPPVIVVPPPIIVAPPSQIFAEPEPAPEVEYALEPEPEQAPEVVAAPTTAPEPIAVPIAVPEPIAVPPTAPAPPVFEAPPAAPVPPAGADTFTSTLRMDRGDLAASLTSLPLTGLPTVAPFLLDVPPSAMPPTETVHRLVLRLGRLSAPFELTKDVTTIGRPDSELHFYPDVEIDLDDAVSRRHAEVIRRGGEYYVTDAGSTNGTLLNGEKLPPHEQRLLAHGDLIHVGERAEIIFE